MRHRVAGRQLNRTSEHRLAMRRNLAASLFEHETISTTIEKAKEVRGFAEKLITLAKKGNLAARRRAIQLLNNRAIYKEEDGQMVKAGTVVGKLFSEIGPRYLDRKGGYTRIIKLINGALETTDNWCCFNWWNRARKRSGIGKVIPNMDSRRIVSGPPFYLNRWRG